MNHIEEQARMEKAKSLASYIMHRHYCENDIEAVTDLFSEQISWFGAGEEQYAVGYDDCVEQFKGMEGAIPKCNIWDEEYDVKCPGQGVYVVTGRMWIATDPCTEMYLKAHQRVTFVFQDTDTGMQCVHIHSSNPYQELMDGEVFPDKIGKQSYEYVQERLRALEEETKQHNRQMEVIMSSIAGGLKISNDDDTYSFAFVSEEAAALFGYTVEEFMEVTGGTAVGNVYPPDLPKALEDCAEAFRDGNLTYATRYRVRCKDGSLKWIIDSGKKAQDADGNWMVNSLYLDITHSEEDAQRLREQTELLTSIYDTVPCGIIRFVRRRDGSYRLISLNKGALALLGYSSQEEALKDWSEGVLGHVMDEDRPAFDRMYQELKKPGDRWDCEYRVKWEDGSIHWLEGNTMIVGITSDGEPILQRTGVDATQRKALQQRLYREQEMYRVSMEVSSSVMFEYLMESDTFISYEPRFGEGVIRHELKNYSKLLDTRLVVHPDDIQIVKDNICNGRSEVFEVRSSVPGGEKGKFFWFRVNSRLLQEDGKPGRVVGTLHNIHSMKSKLSENSERLHMNQSALQAISGVYVSIYYVNLQKDVYYAVRLQEGFRKDELPRRGKYSADLYPYILNGTDESDWSKIAEICHRKRLLEMLGRKREHIEVELRQKSSALWLRLEIHLVGTKEGRAQTAVIAFRNISAEKQRELEYFEEEKKAKLALEEAYESVNRANKAKSEFLSRMSHDIRTPMNAILGMAEIARNNPENKERVEDCLSKINISGEHLLELINEVLDMSKIESGNVSLSEQVFSLNDVLQDVSQIVRPELDGKRQSYSVNVKMLKHDKVSGDLVRLKQILINLLSNAVKYTMENGKISVVLEEKLSSKSGVGCFEFIVEDNGIGMTEEFMEKLFLPFERAEDVRVSQIQGTGLGLAITQNLVQMLNGSISVESKINQGTRFVVTIYLKLADESYTVDKGITKKSEAIRPFLPGTKVLLAEDNSLNQEIVVELLSLYGVDIVCVSNGQEAVERFMSDAPGTYGLILMDIQMPVLDGYGAARKIREFSSIPIIALTANAFADDIYKAKQAGMNEHVTKPLEINYLIEVMHRYLD